MHFTRYLCSLAQNILASKYIVCTYTYIGRSRTRARTMVRATGFKRPPALPCLGLAALIAAITTRDLYGDRSPLSCLPLSLPSHSPTVHPHAVRREFKRCQPAAKNVATNRQLFCFVALTRAWGRLNMWWGAIHNIYLLYIEKDPLYSTCISWHCTQLLFPSLTQLVYSLRRLDRRSLSLIAFVFLVPQMSN